MVRGIWSSLAWALVLCWSGPLTAQEMDLPDLARQWVEQGAAVTGWDSQIAYAAPTYLAGSKFDQRLRINMPIRKGYAHFFTIERSALAATYPAALCNCIYVREYDTIVCDDQFVAQFITSMQVGGEDLEVMISSLNEGFLINWLVGHEIGHILLHSEENPSDEFAVANYDDAFGDLGSAREREADTYMISRLSDRPEIQALGYTALNGFIKRNFSDIARQQHPDFIDVSQTSFDFPKIEVLVREDRHPPALLRGLSLWRHLIDIYPAMIDTTGYFEAMAASIEIERHSGAGRRDWTCGRPLYLDENPVSSPRRPVEEFLLVNRLIEEAEFTLAKTRMAKLLSMSTYKEGKSTEVITEFGRIFDLYIDQRAGASADMLISEMETGWAERTHLRDLDLGVLVATGLLIAQAPQSDLRSARLSEISSSIQARLQKGVTLADLSIPATPAYWHRAIFEIDSALYGLGSEPSNQSLIEFDRQVPKVNFPLEYQHFMNAWGRLIDNACSRGSMSCLNARTAQFHFLQLDGNHIQAAESGEKLIALIDETDPAPPVELRGFWNDRVGYTFLQLGLYDQAIERYKFALNSYERALGSEGRFEDPSQREAVKNWQALALNQLGFLQVRSSKYEAAIQSLTSALEKQSMLKEPSRAEESATLLNLAQSLIASGEYDLGIEHTRAVMKIREEIEAPPTSIEDARITLAAGLYMLGRKEEAKSIASRWKENIVHIQGTAFAIDRNQAILVKDGPLFISEILNEESAPVEPASVLMNRVFSDGADQLEELFSN